MEGYSPLARTRKFSDPLLQDLSNKYTKTPAQIMIRWALQHDMIVIPKSTNKQRIQENLDVFDFQISKKDMDELDGLNENFSVVTWDPKHDSMFK